MGKTKEIDILDILVILAKHKKFIFWTTLITSIAAVIFSLVTPEIWTSTATILPIDNEVSNFSFSSALSGLQSSLLGSSFSSSGTNLTTVMNSRTFSEDVIKSFNLVEYFKITDLDSLVEMHEALDAFGSEMRSIGIDDETGLIFITIQSRDKYLSADIANYYIEKIEEYNLKTSKSKGREKREFIETRLLEVEQDIYKLSQQMLKFQKENKVISLEEQVKAVIDIFSKLEVEKNTFELEKDFLSKSLNSDSPQIIAIDQRLTIINDKIEALKHSSKKADYIFELDRVSDLSLQYTYLEVQLEIQQKVYEFLYPQYESAKIEEVKDLSTVEVVDKAKPAGLRSKPKRAILCIIAFLTALILSSIIALLFQALQKKSSEIKMLKNELFS